MVGSPDEGTHHLQWVIGLLFLGWAILRLREAFTIIVRPRVILSAILLACCGLFALPALRSRLRNVTNIRLTRWAIIGVLLVGVLTAHVVYPADDRTSTLLCAKYDSNDGPIELYNASSEANITAVSASADGDVFAYGTATGDVIWYNYSGGVNRIKTSFDNYSIHRGNRTETPVNEPITHLEYAEENGDIYFATPNRTGYVWTEEMVYQESGKAVGIIDIDWSFFPDGHHSAYVTRFSKTFTYVRGQTGSSGTRYLRFVDRYYTSVAMEYNRNIVVGVGSTENESPEIWVERENETGSFTRAVDSDPVEVGISTKNNIVVAGTQTGTIFLYGTGGKSRWQKSNFGHLVGLSEDGSTIVIQQDTGIVGLDDHGDVRWQTPLRASRTDIPFSEDGDRIMIINETTGRVTVVDRAEPIWQHSFEDESVITGDVSGTGPAVWSVVENQPNQDESRIRAYLTCD